MPPSRRNLVYGVCVHCKQRELLLPRGLCSLCYQKPKVRGMYPRVPDPLPETEEDLDRLIAEQMECLPKWWGKENGRV